MKSKYGPGGEFDPDWFAFLSLSSIAVVDNPRQETTDGNAGSPPSPSPTSGCSAPA